ncbi:hypothetical protein [Mesorhizobium sp. CO1-1-9]|uniref:hypothetical protein n=1 Tax=Mesorhizobium sp. CO1-1-9 TaxID=2876630 RepID=UPI001CCD60F6|nr:hypothetical protein [Mesorhizobium sp. CO1-1-9]MBZ9693923.1 hypothetical protein [Mesorhizobium sp. CO1-1-9]
MMAFLVSNPFILALGAGIVAAAGAWVHGRVSGAKANEAKHDAERLQARTVADKIDQAVAGMTDAEVLKGQAKWSRPKS